MNEFLNSLNIVKYLRIRLPEYQTKEKDLLQHIKNMMNANNQQDEVIIFNSFIKNNLHFYNWLITVIGIKACGYFGVTSNIINNYINDYYNIIGPSYWNKNRKQVTIYFEYSRYRHFEDFANVKNLSYQKACIVLIEIAIKYLEETKNIKNNLLDYKYNFYHQYFLNKEIKEEEIYEPGMITTVLEKDQDGNEVIYQMDVSNNMDLFNDKINFLTYS